MQPQRRQAARGHARPSLVRIIGGQWKRTPLPVLEAEGLRPTPDRVRETVFNWLDHLMGRDWQHVRCLDLFAGTGALGFEAASRGAADVVLLDSHPGVIRHLNVVRDKLGAQHTSIVRADAQDYLRKCSQDNARFNLIFADPPYHHGWLEKILPASESILAPDGLFYVESEFALDTEGVPWLAGWSVVRTGKAGMVFYHILQRSVVQNGA